MSYASRTSRPPATLTDDEQRRLLETSGKHVDGFRDHVLFSIALGMGLRESEIVALNVGDVCDVTRRPLRPRRVVQLRVFKRAGANADPRDHRVHVPDGTYYKLQKYLNARFRAGRRADADAPLFLSREANRLSTRRLRELFHEWQARAKFDHRYNFHALRHTAITNVRRATGDIRIAQRLARHRHIQTTTIYDHVSDEELSVATRGLRS